MKGEERRIVQGEDEVLKVLARQERTWEEY